MAPVFVTNTTHNVGGAAPALLGVWIYFNLIVNTILLPLLVATFLFSSRTKRHPTLVNLCLAWIFSGVYSLILFYAKKHVGPEPSRSLCIGQSTLLFGVTPMWSVAILMLFYYMTTAVRCGPTKTAVDWWKLVFMLAAPYIAQFSFSVAALFISLSHPERVSRDFRVLYCALHYPKLGFAMGTFTLIMCVGIVCLEVHLCLIAYRNACGLRKAGKCANGVDYQFYLRVLIFGGYVTFGMVMNVVSMFIPRSAAPDIYAATAGTAVFLVFGTQPDVLSVWCFWRREPEEGPSFSYIDKYAFWRRVESPDLRKVDIEDMPPLPPPKSREYMTRMALENSPIIEITKPPPYRLA
ncbi:hypothetical protein GALMADRAFT_853771 [Galerina marginata CBS 339.88]|uniref:G-protein coupled receptors family 2 profile 2 domain-containing protein n=1 Tax=Galerina marginata (strain CBS 339.88) TaxID=685588 RepID=A0A067THZ1_GALM3|nr:hypothetical protein GALMADRAFT_853771 [Galerina marginata CBS 339.88]